MEIIDTHMHINLNCNSGYYRNKKIEEYNKTIENTNIAFFIPSINPKTTIFSCDKDCSNECEILSNKKEIVCPVNCNKRNRHRVKIVDGLQGSLIAYCTQCNKIIYEGKDPIRKYNIELIDICKDSNSMPNLLLTLSNTTINEEILFYEKNYPNLFLGYKIHQTTNMRSINEIIKVDSLRPILIHCDSHEYDSIENAIEFSKRYKGNIILAHSYLLTNSNLISNCNNIYFDICPTDNFKQNKENINHNHNYDLYSNMFKAAINYLPEDKLLFGTDWPYGNVEKNIKEIEKSNIKPKTKQKILSLNAKKAYHI